MEIKKKYRRGWFNIFERKEVSFREIDHTKIKTPFKHLPERFYLTEEEKRDNSLILSSFRNRKKFRVR